MEKSQNSMKKMTKLTLREEIANVMTHGLMALAFLLLLPFSAIYTYQEGGTLLAVGTSIFVLSIFAMLFSSTLYHAMPYGTYHKFVFRILDHIFIYFAIAGSYTPVALYLIGGWKGILILIIQWSCVLFGIYYKGVMQRQDKRLSLIIYLLMGWVAVFFLPTLIQNSRPIFLAFIVLGGIFYSIGAYFYAQKKKWAHVIWHLFINVATLSHFIAIVFFMT